MAGMIVFAREDRIFNHRVAAVLLHGDSVLLHRGTGDDFWSLPGGRVEFGETTAQALTRELHEELGVTVAVGRLQWLAECFFEHADSSFHQVALYYLVSVPPDASFLRTSGSFHGEEGDRLIFQWHPLGTLGEVALFPVFLQKGLRAIPEQTVHVVERDNQEHA